MKRPEIWLGDFVDAVAALGITDPHERSEVARTLGIAPLPPPVVQQVVRATAGADLLPATIPMTLPMFGSLRPPAPPTKPPAPSSVAASAALVVSNPTQRPMTRPSWLAKPLAGKATAVPVPLPHAPLLRVEWSRAFLGAIAAIWREEREIDPPRLVDAVAQGKPLAKLPRRRGQSVRLGAYFVIDAGRELEPLARDVAYLVGRAKEILGVQTVVEYVRGSPAQLAMPAAGTPVVIASALGSVAVESAELDADLHEPAWEAYVVALERARCPTTLLVPVPPARWPAWVARRSAAILWDRATTPALAANAIRRDRARR